MAIADIKNPGLDSRIQLHVVSFLEGQGHDRCTVVQSDVGHKNNQNIRFSGQYWPT